jgi:hypothetical protein
MNSSTPHTNLNARLCQRVMNFQLLRRLQAGDMIRDPLTSLWFTCMPVYALAYVDRLLCMTAKLYPTHDCVDAYLTKLTTCQRLK